MRVRGQCSNDVRVFGENELQVPTFSTGYVSIPSFSLKTATRKCDAFHISSETLSDIFLGARE